MLLNLSHSHAAHRRIQTLNVAAQRYELLGQPGELQARLRRVSAMQARFLAFEGIDRLRGRVEPRDQRVEPLDRGARGERREELAGIASSQVVGDGRQLVG